MSVIHDALEKDGSYTTCSGPLNVISLGPFSKGRPAKPGRIPAKVLRKGFLGLCGVAGVAGMTLLAASMGPSREGESSAGRVEAVQPAVSYSRPNQAVFPRTAARPVYVLTGIIEGKERQAVINNDIVAMGDRVGAGLVKIIGEKNVVLEHEGRDVYLSLK